MDAKELVILIIAVILTGLIGIVLGVFTAEVVLWIVDYLNFALDEHIFRSAWLTVFLLGCHFGVGKCKKEENCLYI